MTTAATLTALALLAAIVTASILRASSRLRNDAARRAAIRGATWASVPGILRQRAAERELEASLIAGATVTVPAELVEVDSRGFVYWKGTGEAGDAT